MSTESALDFQAMAYVKTVVEYNNQVLKGGLKPNLAERFAQTAATFNDRVSWENAHMECKLIISFSFRT